MCHSICICTYIHIFVCAEKTEETEEFDKVCYLVLLPERKRKRKRKRKRRLKEKPVSQIAMAGADGEGQPKSLKWRSLEDVPAGPISMDGHDLCFRNAADLLEAMGLPGGLLPLENVIDCGFDKTSGTMWIRQKKKTQHYFRRIGRMVSYDTEIRARIGDHRLHSISGVKAKEFLVWTPIFDVSAIEDKLKFRSYGGILRTFCADAFARGE